MDTVRGEGLSIEVEYLIIHFIATCDDESYLDAAKYVTNGEGVRVSVTFFERLGEVTS